MSGLIGRDQEVAQVGALLLGETALVTITGPGGVGKTRVALAVADRVRPEFPGGVVFVPLASITDPNLVLSTVATAAGVTTGAGDPFDRLERHLRGTDTLLVLDNLEHLVEAAPRLADLLAACPQLRMAATSRTRLRLSSEQEFPLQPLAAADCVSLFVERARAVRPDFETGEASIAAIEELCARLDRLPLAIELAAARAKLLSPQAMRARLGDRLTFLAGGARDAPTRHQALRSTLDWSHDLLGIDERRLFARIAVFAGGFDLAAAEAICDADLDSLSILVDNSLVQADGDRFHTLQTVRDYAQEQLAASGEEGEIRGKHAAFFLALAEDAAPRVLFGAEQARWLDALDAEHHNLRAALDHSLTIGDWETAVRLGSALWSFWLERGHIGEGRRWLGLALEAAGNSEAAAPALTGAGLLAHYDGDYAGAEALCRASVELHAAAGDRGGKAAALEGLALSLRTRGDFLAAKTIFDEALTIFRELGDAEGTARTLDRLGIAVWFDGDDEMASACIAESLEIFRRLGNRGGIGLALTDLGLVSLGGEDREAPQELLEEGLAVSRELSDRRNIAKALLGLGDLAGLHGNRVEAATRYDEGLSVAVEYGFPWLVILHLERLAGLLASASPERSAQVFGAAEELRESIGAPMPAYFKRLYDAELATLRAGIDRDPLEAAWAEGRAMGADRAAAVARAALLPASAPAEEEELTAREAEVLGLVALGLTDAQVAERLVVSIRTVHAHLRSIYRKLGVNTRTAASRYAVEHGPAQDR